jgi:hypothetical protein
VFIVGRPRRSGKGKRVRIHTRKNTNSREKDRVLIFVLLVILAATSGENEKTLSQPGSEDIVERAFQGEVAMRHLLALLCFCWPPLLVAQDDGALSVRIDMGATGQIQYDEPDRVVLTNNSDKRQSENIT